MWGRNKGRGRKEKRRIKGKGKCKKGEEGESWVGANKNGGDLCVRGYHKMHCSMTGLGVCQQNRLSIQCQLLHICSPKKALCLFVMTVELYFSF